MTRMLPFKKPLIAGALGCAAQAQPAPPTPPLAATRPSLAQAVAAAWQRSIEVAQSQGQQRQARADQRSDPAVADEKLRMVERVIQGRGFVTIPETLNAVDAWLSSIPGHAYANVRQPIVSTLNLAHMMPLSAVWAGPERNKHLDGPPVIVTRTDGAMLALFSDKWRLQYIEKEHGDLTLEPLVATAD